MLPSFRAEAVKVQQHFLFLRAIKCVQLVLPPWVIGMYSWPMFLRHDVQSTTSDMCWESCRLKICSNDLVPTYLNVIPPYRNISSEYI